MAQKKTYYKGATKLQKGDRKALHAINIGANTLIGGLVANPIGARGTLIGAGTGATIGAGASARMALRNRRVDQHKMSEKEAVEKNTKTVERSTWGSLVGGVAVPAFDLTHRLRGRYKMMEGGGGAEPKSRFKGAGIALKDKLPSVHNKVGAKAPHIRLNLRKPSITRHKTDIVGGTAPFAHTKSSLITFSASKKGKLISKTKFPTQLSHSYGSMQVGRPGGRTGMVTAANQVHLIDRAHTHYNLNAKKGAIIAGGTAAAAGGGYYAYKHRGQIKDFYYRRLHTGKRVKVKKGKRQGKRK